MKWRAEVVWQTGQRCTIAEIREWDPLSSPLEYSRNAPEVIPTTAPIPAPCSVCRLSPVLYVESGHASECDRQRFGRRDPKHQTVAPDAEHVGDSIVERVRRGRDADAITALGLHRLSCS